MSVRPIDLQTLFSQLNQVGKEQAAEKNAALLHQAQQGQALVRQAEQSNHSINQTDKTQEGLDTVGEQGQQAGGQPGKGKKEPEQKEKPEKEFFRDPDMGKNLDITG